jgi:hypothetical protein
MPLPRDEKSRDELLRFIAGGNRDAENYLRVMTQTVRLADNLADESLTFTERQQHVMRILYAEWCVLPSNPFYHQHAAQLAPLLEGVLTAWEQSDKWKATGDTKQKMFGFVRRENIDSLAVAVAAIVGGLDHARKVIDLLYDVCHNTGETFEDWTAEDAPWACTTPSQP